MMIVNNNKIRKNPNKSLIIKYGLKGDNKYLFIDPKGFLDPEIWRKNKCIMTINIIIKGKIKCIV